MRMVFLIISMAIVAYLTATYLTHPSVMVPGANGPQAPQDVLDQTRIQTRNVEQQLAAKAAAPIPNANQ